MKAILFEHYGPPEDLVPGELPKPVPKDNEVLVKVRAASVNAADWHILRADPFLVRLMFGLRKPRIKVLGADIAGRVEAVGRAVKRWKAEDEVFGCLGVLACGAFAEYACAPEDRLARKPARLSFEAAAAVPLAALTALQALRNAGGIRKGQRVLINGASRGVGTFAVQIAKALGAEVTAVCSGRNADLARSLGADHVIDYGKEDFTRQDKRYDLILGANGYHPLSAYKRSLAPHGRYVMIGGKGRQMAQAIFFGPIRSLGGNRKLTRVDMKPNQADLESIREFLESGQVAPVLDRTYPLGQVPEAIRYLEEGHSRGKVVISVPG